MRSASATAATVLILALPASAFQVLPRVTHYGSITRGQAPLPRVTTELFSTPRRRRVRRKDPAGDSNPTPPESEAVVEPTPEPEPEQPKAIETTPVPELKPREEKVEFVVQDIRDVVSGKPLQEVVETAADEEEDDDDEYEWVDIDEEEDDDYEYVYETPAGQKMDSLEQLLADARAMRAQEKEDSGEDSESFSIPDALSKVISTIITVDFFFVCVLLLWFVAGIFGQYVLKDTTIQIAFNNIFEPIVQPALGVLMIGSAAGQFLNKDEEEDGFTN